MSMIGKLFTGAVDVAGGFLSGNPIGGIASAAGALFGGSRPAPPVPAGSMPGGGGSGTAIQLPFGLGGFTHMTGGGGGTAPAAAGGACPKGYHLNKHALPACKRHGAVPAHSICVRNRHMNAMNGRAVSRAARRIHRGEKLLRRIFSVEGHKHGAIKPKGHRR